MADRQDNHPPRPVLRPIGVIRTPFAVAPGTPIQSRYGREARGEVIVWQPYAAALDDLEGFERIWLIFWLDRAAAFRPRLVPYRDTTERGLFATRAPCRPNPLGLSAVRLLGREGNRLQVADLDMLDNTPLLDIKPYVPEFDAHPDSEAGWLDRCGEDRRVADERFHGEDGTLLAIGSPDELVIELKQACIETTARRVHRALVDACLAGRRSGPLVEAAIDLLQQFLRSTNFRQLRAAHPRLAGGSPCRVRLRRDDPATVSWMLVADDRA
jgi:tRNA-Thr(GGU) m(6)t(6)A37 methyltransferase TsaA